MKITLPNDDLEAFVRLIKTHGNTYVDKLKNIILWENISTSSIVSNV